MNQAGRMGLSFLFAPVEVLRRVIGWHYRVRGEYVYRCPDTGRTITVKDRMEYDSFTYAPNLRRQDGGPSRAAQVHDVGWNRGTWDPDEWDREYFLSFRQNNDAFRQILLEENPPLPLDSPRRIVNMWRASQNALVERTINAYCWGVSLPRMQKLWVKSHGHL
tara:strand:- start:798 stop:1286 length:489 start_codon:yes stop_codon:yes gene_type:complete